MKVLLDTNVLISALLSSNSLIAHTVYYLSSEHQIYVTSQILSELRLVIKRKLPQQTANIATLLEQLDFQIIDTFQRSAFVIRDPHDQDILDAAISAKVDIILTGDKDFLDLPLTSPRCLSVRDFVQEFCPFLLIIDNK